MSGVKKSLQAATLPWRRFGPQAAAVPPSLLKNRDSPLTSTHSFASKDGDWDQCCALRLGWVVFHRGRIHEFKDRTRFRGSGLVSLGCGLPYAAKALGSCVNLLLVGP